jgi:hypothetical protein
MIGKCLKNSVSVYQKLYFTCKNPFTDRFVMVGDASISRIFKNGLESAYITSQLAVRAAFEKGISSEDFARHYYKPARKTTCYG